MFLVLACQALTANMASQKNEVTLENGKTSMTINTSMGGKITSLKYQMNTH